MRRANRRRGVILVAAIVCILLVSAVVAGMLQTSLRQRLELRREHWRQQAAWLAQSALERAVRQLASDASYRGETWRPAGMSEPSGVVQIRIAEDDRGWQLAVVADFPDDPFQRARVTRRLPIAKPGQTATPTSQPRTGNRPPTNGAVP